MKDLRVAYFVLIFITVGFFVPTYDTHAARNSVDVSSPQILKEWQQRGGFTADLETGVWSADVVFLKKILRVDNATYAYDTETEEALKAFQKKNKLRATGSFDANTRTVLNEQIFESLCPTKSKGRDLNLHQITDNTLVPASYIPKLAPIHEDMRTAVPLCVEKETAQALARMFAAAENKDVKLMVTSGYRSQAMQAYLYEYWTSKEGIDAAHEVAQPGHSEHQLGTAVDLTDSSIQYSGVDDAFAKSAGGKWLKKNAHKYGFTMSYQKGKEKITGFHHEPWHWRYVGKDVAMKLNKEKKTFAEYSRKATKQELAGKNKKESLE